MFENVKSWWLKKGGYSDFIRSFAESSYGEIVPRDPIKPGISQLPPVDPTSVSTPLYLGIPGTPKKLTGAKRKRPLSTKLGQELIKTGQVLFDSLLETGDLDYYRYDENKVIAGYALFFTFFGMDFRWITYSRGDFEPLPSDELLMDQELFDNYRIVIGEIDVDSLVNEIQEDYSDVFVGFLPDIINYLVTDRYYKKHAKPIFGFEDGDIVIDDFNINYDHSGENLYAYIRNPMAFGIVADFDVVGKTLGSIVRWKDVGLPFHAWDLGFSDGPVDE